MMNESLEIDSSLVVESTDIGREIGDIVYKQYLQNLDTYCPIPLDESYKSIDKLRIFKITEIVYKNDEFSTFKLASVFGALQHLDCNIFLILNCDGTKTDIYMGVRNLNNDKSTSSVKKTLEKSLIGQFPGVKTKNLMDESSEALISKFANKNISCVSCVADIRHDELHTNQSFVQGLEKFINAMNGQIYTGIVLAKSITLNELSLSKLTLENIYSQLSPFQSVQYNLGVNISNNISDAITNGISESLTHTQSNTEQNSTTKQESISKTITEGLSKTTLLNKFKQKMTKGWLGAEQKNSSKSKSATKSESYSSSTSVGTSDSVANSKNQSNTKTFGHGITKNENRQITLENKTIKNILNKIDTHLERIKECESMGMWECATYFLSDNQETVEIAAGTYKSLMKGEDTGVEVSAINYWPKFNINNSKVLDYLCNFLHPKFELTHTYLNNIVTPATLVSTNELALHMGLPRNSVSGFPVIEHAEFGLDVVKYDNAKGRTINIGQVYHLGQEFDSKVLLDLDSLSMHTFISGSTGSGKSNTLYTLLKSLNNKGIPFLVIEPTKGEYKYILGDKANVYGTNPNITNLLKVNPFSFPEDIHVLEHIDRLVEIFNACWPMYAAMPAILKDAIQKTYENLGWDIYNSHNDSGNIFPNFKDLICEVNNTINESSYSDELKSNYVGALITRLKSLTIGLTGMMFNSDEISNQELFDKNVIVDLSRIGSSETKSLIMGILMMKLNEYRSISGNINSHLNHITILEEAHNLLRRVENNSSSDSGNLQAKAVEMISNSIAEMRTYGEGFVIVDQSPGLLDLSAIRNTNTKIVLRLPDGEDRKVVGTSMGLNDEQIKELAKLRKGVAAIYQNDWIQPVLVKIHKYEGNQVNYHYSESSINNLLNKIDLLKILISSRSKKSFDISTQMLCDLIRKMNLSGRSVKLLYNAIESYNSEGNFTLWDADSFSDLSFIIYELLDDNNCIKQIVHKSIDVKELNYNFNNHYKKIILSLGRADYLNILQCIIYKLLYLEQLNENETQLCMDWYKYLARNGIIL